MRRHAAYWRTSASSTESEPRPLFSGHLFLGLFRGEPESPLSLCVAGGFGCDCSLAAGASPAGFFAASVAGDVATAAAVLVPDVSRVLALPSGGHCIARCALAIGGAGCRRFLRGTRRRRVARFGHVTCSVRYVILGAVLSAAPAPAAASAPGTASLVWLSSCAGLPGSAACTSGLTAGCAVFRVSPWRAWAVLPWRVVRLPGRSSCRRPVLRRLLVLRLPSRPPSR